MRRISCLLSLALLSAAVPSRADEPLLAVTGSQATPDLKDVLEKGLRARRPEEFAFIATVLTHVNNGTLPRDLVEGTFLWARKHPQNEFQYFEFALRDRAKKIGVTL